METFSHQCRDGVWLRGDSFGSGPPVVLLHGGGQTRHSWRATAALLGENGWRAIAIDMRGHGDSDFSPDGGYLPSTFAADIADLLADLDSPAVLVGASLGGLCSVLALGELPETRAAGLVLVDVAHRFELVGANRIIDFMRGSPDGFTDPSEAMAAVAEYLPHRPPPGDVSGIEKNLRLRDGRWHWHWDPRLLEMSDPLLNEGNAEIQARLSASLREIDVPTMLVRGAFSDVVSQSIADEFAVLVPDARIVDVAEAGHMVAGDDNDLFTRAILGFLNDLEGAPLR